jgi:hypothetical protein
MFTKTVINSVAGVAGFAGRFRLISVSAARAALPSDKGIGALKTPMRAATEKKK